MNCFGPPAPSVSSRARCRCFKLHLTSRKLRTHGSSEFAAACVHPDNDPNLRKKNKNLGRGNTEARSRGEPFFVFSATPWLPGEAFIFGYTSASAQNHLHSAARIGSHGTGAAARPCPGH